jgi:hypothetical protein
MMTSLVMTSHSTPQHCAEQLIIAWHAWTCLELHALGSSVLRHAAASQRRRHHGVTAG